MSLVTIRAQASDAPTIKGAGDAGMGAAGMHFCQPKEGGTIGTGWPL